MLEFDARFGCCEVPIGLNTACIAVELPSGDFVDKGLFIMERKLIAEYERLHRASNYGNTGSKSLSDILPHILALAPSSLIDYGCGQSDLAAKLARKANIAHICCYDPAIPELSERPREHFDVLVSIDVLEHIPDSEINSVLADMASLATHALIVVDTGPAATLLSDGSNAHVSQHDGTWWFARLRPHFPALRPIPIARKRRIAFKTFHAQLSPVAHHWIVLRENVIRRATRFRRKFRDSRPA